MSRNLSRQDIAEIDTAISFLFAVLQLARNQGAEVPAIGQTTNGIPVVVDRADDRLWIVQLSENVETKDTP